MGKRKTDEETLDEIEEHRHEETTYGIAGMFLILLAFVWLILGTQLQDYRRWQETSSFWYALTTLTLVLGVICLCFAAYHSKKRGDLLKSRKSKLRQTKKEV
ncbi:MAG: hypothetical protein QW270_06430 [Candidatus Bathyarchaeia archaeon]